MRALVDNESQTGRDLARTHTRMRRHTYMQNRSNRKILTMNVIASVGSVTNGRSHRHSLTPRGAPFIVMSNRGTVDSEREAITAGK